MVPQHDCQQLKTWIVHFGSGALHRAHQALLTDRVLDVQGGDQGVCEISLSSGDRLVSQLREQGHLFTVLEEGANGNQPIVIGAVNECLNTRLDSLVAIIGKFCEPQVAIVPLIIIEKSYCIDPATGSLDLSNPCIAHDLRIPTELRSVPRIIVEAPCRRYERGLQSLTVLSRDNIPDNGHVVKDAVLGMVEKRSPEPAAWIQEHVNFPGTMVDRAVPAVTEESLAEIARELGVADPCAISCEPFIQQVIEDNFVCGRPRWETADVQMVENVLPQEQMKLRILNGSHLSLVYLGYLVGFQHISDCMQDSVFHEAAYRLMLNEQTPMLQVTDVDLDQYVLSLSEHFANPALKRKAWQIAVGGSQELPQHMLEEVRVYLTRQSEWPLLALDVAGWMHYMSGMDSSGTITDVHDPLSEKIAALVKQGAESGRVNALFSLREIFAIDLVQNPQFIAAIQQAWQHIAQCGAHRAAIETLKD